MGAITLVPLTELWAPLAPGTVAFSIEVMPGCWTHIRHVKMLPAYKGEVRRDGRIKLRHELFTYDKLYSKYRMFLVEPRMITETQPDTVLAPGDTIIAFDVIDKPCTCSPRPFVLTSPGWLMAGGITAERLDLAADRQLGFSSNPAGWRLVVAGWNYPISPLDLSQGEPFILFDSLKGKVIPHSFGSINDNFLSFADGGGTSLEAIGEGYWIFRGSPS